MSGLWGPSCPPSVPPLSLWPLVVRVQAGLVRAASWARRSQGTQQALRAPPGRGPLPASACPSYMDPQPPDVDLVCCETAGGGALPPRLPDIWGAAPREAGGLGRGHPEWQLPVDTLEPSSHSAAWACKATGYVENVHSKGTVISLRRWENTRSAWPHESGRLGRALLFPSCVRQTPILPARQSCASKYGRVRAGQHVGQTR